MPTYSWTTGTSGNWTTAANWTPGTVPNEAAADVTIDAAPTAGAYTVTIAAGESVTVNSLTVNGTTNRPGTNIEPYNAAILAIDGTLAFADGSPGRLAGPLQTVVVMQSGTIVNLGTADAFIQGEGNVLITGTNAINFTNWIQALAGTITVDTQSMAVVIDTTLWDGIFEAKGPGSVINLGGPLQDLIVNIETIVGPPMIPTGWTELLLNDPTAQIQQWNGTGYVSIESTLKHIGNRSTLDVLAGRTYTTANTLTIDDGGMLNLQAGAVTTGGIDINGGVVQGFATIAGNVVNDGTLVPLGGALVLNGDLSGTGVVKFDVDQKTGTASPIGATLEVHGVSAGQTFLMDGNDTLILDTPATFLGTINAEAGDKIVLQGVNATSAVVTGDTLVISDGATVVNTIKLGGSYAGETYVTNGSTISVGSGAPSATNFAILDTTTQVATTAAGEAYSGPVAGLQWQYINITTNNLNITSSVPNVFLRSGSGMDALDVSQANGNNVLDGSTGSNFLVGGTGNDTFYLDNRNPDSPVFSTIVNFNAGDDATVWGVNASDFTMLILDNQGAAGFTGLDLIFTAPGRVDTSFVLAGYTSADLTNGRLSMSYGTTPDLPGLPGSQYLTVHAN
jgi:hypothetical protein